MLNRNIQKPLQDQLADLLEVQIKDGEFSADEKLPSLRGLAKRYKVSHETVNGAMGILKTRGFVRIVPNRGVYVTSSDVGTMGRDTGFIGLVIDLGVRKPKSSVVSPLYGDFLALVSQELNKYNYHLAGNYICIEDDKDRQILSNLSENKVDGLIVCNLFYEPLHDYVRDNFKSVVSLLPAEPFDEFDQVQIDIYRTYYRITEELVGRGVKKIRIVNGPNPHYNFYEIVRGVKDVCLARGLEGCADEDFVIAAEGWEHADAESRIQQWLDEGGEADLLLCSNDNMALGAFNAVQNRGLKVPGDIRVLGGRNTPLCTMVRPQLSSVDWHYSELVRMAVRQLIERINGGEAPPTNFQIGGSLVERGTL